MDATHNYKMAGVGSVCCQQSLLVIDRPMFDQRIVEDRLSHQVQETGRTQIFHLVSQLCFHPETDYMRFINVLPDKTDIAQQVS